MGCLFTITELKRLHHRFGHPNADKLFNLLRRSELKNITSVTRQLLENITRRCKQFPGHSSASHRIKSSLRENKKFNHSILVDIFYIEKKPVLHVVA